MKRGFLAGVLATLLLMCLVGTASATSGKVQQEIEYRDIKVSLDGQVLDLRDAKGNTVEPFMFAGTNYIPARALAESLGLQVAWDGSTATVVLTHPEASKPTYHPHRQQVPQRSPLQRRHLLGSALQHRHRHGPDALRQVRPLIYGLEISQKR